MIKEELRGNLSFPLARANIKGGKGEGGGCVIMLSDIHNKAKARTLQSSSVWSCKAQAFITQGRNCLQQSKPQANEKRSQACTREQRVVSTSCSLAIKSSAKPGCVCATATATSAYGKQDGWFRQICSSHDSCHFADHGSIGCG